MNKIISTSELKDPTGKNQFVISKEDNGCSWYNYIVSQSCYYKSAAKNFSFLYWKYIAAFIKLEDAKEYLKINKIKNFLVNK